MTDEKKKKWREIFPEGIIEDILHGKGGKLLSPIDEIIVRRLWGIDYDTPIECQQHGPNEQILCYGLGWNIFYSMASKHYPNFENPVWSSLGSRESAQWLEREREGSSWPSAKEMTKLFDDFGNFLETQEEIGTFKDEFPDEWARIQEEMKDPYSKEKFEGFLKDRWERRKRMMEGTH